MTIYKLVGRRIPEHLNLHMMQPTVIGFVMKRRRSSVTFL